MGIINTYNAFQISTGIESKPGGFVRDQQMKVSQETFSFQLEPIFKLSFASDLAAPSKPLLF